MERRVVLAIVLAVAVLFLTPRLFPPARRSVPPVPTQVDTPQQQTTVPSAAPSVPSQRPAEAVTPADSSVARIDTTSITTPQATHLFRNLGAELESVQLSEFKALNGNGAIAHLDSPWDPLLSYSIVLPNDTIPLQRTLFAETVDPTGRSVEYRARVKELSVLVRYAPTGDRYLTRVSGEITDTAGRPVGDSAYLVITLPRGLRSFEANPVEDARGATAAFKRASRSASLIRLGSVDPNERRIESGPLSWVAFKSKYFILGLIEPDSTAPFAELQVQGLPRPDRNTPLAKIDVVKQVRAGKFGFDVYTGPQKWDVMREVGREFGSANAYGGWLQPVVQPFATIVMRVLLWIHRALNLHYGWVLLLFGVIVRIAMWPLNQTAMRSSMRMQELQPLLSEVQKRYKSDPQRMSAETMKLYKEHGMSPFSPLAGCFPILLSMPVLFALFFVFQSTIEFRGVPFLWLGDISIKDSLYIAPLLMGGSMFLTSWLSMRSSPPNPQTRMMTYILPVMMTVLLANMASGLNLYWAAQNIASLPQQWLIARERARKRQAAKPA
ncbi:MAG TPA: membrane protein insertase YidC [Gemmatimonadaceae bacterium]|nr:membrane protein insertase YidC [Gemmatimonadaceae bacterium]